MSTENKKGLDIVPLSIEKFAFRNISLLFNENFWTHASWVYLQVV